MIPDTLPVTGRPFEQVPVASAEGLLFTSSTAFVFDPADEEILPRFDVGEGERILAPFHRFGVAAAILTTEALYLFDSIDPGGGAGLPLVPRARIPLEGDARDLERVDLIRHAHGYLVSALYGARSDRGLAGASQVLYVVGEGPRVEARSSEELPPGTPAWYRFRGDLASPLTSRLSAVAWSLAAPDRPRGESFVEALRLRSPPASVLWLVLVCLLLGGGLTVGFARRRGLSRPARWVWGAAAFLGGITVWMAFLILIPRASPKPSPAP